MSNTAKVVLFPMWKHHCNSLDRLKEVLQHAEAKPGNMNSLIVIWQDAKGIRHFAAESDLLVSKAVFQLEMAKLDLLKDMG